MAADAGSAMADVTDDAFLAGALRILQPQTGYRAGSDAVFLAAALPASAARPCRVLDVGAGVGTVGLCIAHRLPGANVVAVERDPALAALAAENARRNGLADRVHVVVGDVTARQGDLDPLGLATESFDHVVANPPFHTRGHGTAATDIAKAAAHAMSDDDLPAWLRFMTRMLKPGGSLTVIHKAEALPSLLDAIAQRAGGLYILPLHPRADAATNRIIVQGWKGSRAPLTLLPGFVMHGAGHAATPAAAAILREGAALSLRPTGPHQSASPDTV